MSAASRQAGRQAGRLLGCGEESFCWTGNKRQPRVEFNSSRSRGRCSGLACLAWGLLGGADLVWKGLKLRR